MRNLVAKWLAMKMLDCWCRVRIRYLPWRPWQIAGFTEQYSNLRNLILRPIFKNWHSYNRVPVENIPCLWALCPTWSCAAAHSEGIWNNNNNNFKLFLSHQHPSSICGGFFAFCFGNKYQQALQSFINTVQCQCTQWRTGLINIYMYSSTVFGDNLKHLFEKWAKLM